MDRDLKLYLVLSRRNFLFTSSSQINCIVECLHNLITGCKKDIKRCWWQTSCYVVGQPDKRFFLISLHTFSLDINECRDGLHDCHGNATCTNTKGSFSCSCKEGFIGDGKESCRGEYNNEEVKQWWRRRQVRRLAKIEFIIYLQISLSISVQCA